MKVSREKLQQIIQEELQQMDEEGELDEVGGLKALGAMGRSLAGSVGSGLAKGASAVGKAVGGAASAVGKQVGKAASAVGTQATKAGQAVGGAVNKAMDAGKQAKIKAVEDEIAKLQGQLTQLKGGAAQPAAGAPPAANIQRSSAGGAGSPPVAGASKKVEIPRSDGSKTVGQTLSGEAAAQQLKTMGQNEEQIKQALQAIQAGTHSLVSFTDEKTGKPAAKLVPSSQAKELAEMLRRKKLEQSKKRTK